MFFISQKLQSPGPNYHMQILLLCPQKNVTLQKAAACMSMPSCPTTLKPKRNMSQSNNDDDNFNLTTVRKIEEEDCEAEYEVVEDLLKNMRDEEEILSERMVSCTIISGKVSFTSSTLAIQKTPPSRRRSMICKNLWAMFKPGKSKARQWGRSRRAISAGPACMYLLFHIIIKLLTVVYQCHGYCEDHAFFKGANILSRTGFSTQIKCK